MPPVRQPLPDRRVKSFIGLSAVLSGLVVWLFYAADQATSGWLR